MPERTVETIRRELAAEFEPRAQRARSRWPVSVRDEEIAGVEYQIVTPTFAPVSGRLLYFFGGGYVSGCPEYDLPITAALAAQAGVEIIALRYLLAPEYPCPSAFVQGLAVYMTLASDGPLSLAGESAGGGLALAILHMAFDLGKPLPDRLVLFSPWIDLTPEGIARCEDIDDPLLAQSDLPLMADLYRGDRPAADPIVSPTLEPIPEGWPATFLTTGSRDRLGPDTRTLAKRIVAAGASCTLIDEEGMGHVFEAYDELPAAARSLAAAAAFISG